jgi:hypothetical protein
MAFFTRDLFFTRSSTKAPTRCDIVDLAVSDSGTDSDTGEDTEIAKHTGKGKGPAWKKRRREDFFNAKENWSSEDGAGLAKQLHDEWNPDSPPINPTGETINWITSPPTARRHATAAAKMVPSTPVRMMYK